MHRGLFDPMLTVLRLTQNAIYTLSEFWNRCKQSKTKKVPRDFRGHIFVYLCTPKGGHALRGRCCSAALPGRGTPPLPCLFKPYRPTSFVTPFVTSSPIRKRKTCKPQESCATINIYPIRIKFTVLEKALFKVHTDTREWWNW